MKKVKTPTALSKAPCIILARPQLAENIGMVARAMMNCGLYDLRLVSPREHPTDDKAIAASSGASIILDQATIYDSVNDAIADTHLILATTARPREMTKPVYHPKKAMELVTDTLQSGQKCGILFGAERTGLENGELVMADGIIEIPLNPAHMSLNLSQAVLLIGYEWYQSEHGQDNSRYETAGSDIATKQQVDAFLSHLENELENRGYFRFADKKERMSRNLRNIFTRDALTTSEIKTLHGVINDLTREENHD